MVNRKSQASVINPIVVVVKNVGNKKFNTQKVAKTELWMKRAQEEAWLRNIEKERIRRLHEEKRKKEFVIPEQFRPFQAQVNRLVREIW
jgi:hypothetical protein